jgi:hypothetical protein
MFDYGSYDKLPRAPSPRLSLAGIVSEHAAQDIVTWKALCKNIRFNGMNIDQDSEDLEVVNQRSQ